MLILFFDTLEETLLHSLSDRINKDLSHRFSQPQLLTLAKESGFHKRTSKLKPWMFLNVVSFSAFNSSKQSLQQHSCELQLEHELDISKQGFDQRFNNSSVEFMRKLLEQSITDEYQTEVDHSLFKEFNRVRIKDSTSFGLPENMKTLFPGNGGASITEATGKIQFEYDIKTGDVIDLSLTPGRVNDFQNTYSTKEDIRKDDLLIRDLGYVTIDYMKHIETSEAFFINRLRGDTAIFEKKKNKYVRVSYKQLHKELGNKLCMEKEVFIGLRKYFPVRLIITKVPEDKIESRIIRQKKKSIKRVAKYTRQSFLDNIGLNLFVTNVNKVQLDTIDIYNLYKLRWQIEIIFKIWKSIGQIHINIKSKPERITTMLYAKLLSLMVNWKVIKSIIHLPLKNNRKALSIYKCFKQLIVLKKIMKRIIAKQSDTSILLLKLFELLLNKCLSEERQGKDSYSMIIKQYIG